MGLISFSNISAARLTGNISLFVFPNPASSQLTIVHSFEAGTELSMINAMGQQVWNKKILSTVPMIRQDISFLPKGVYRIKTGEASKCFVVE